VSAAVTPMRTAPVLGMLRKQTWAEFIKLFRVPAFSTTSIVLPAMFYAFIGLGQAKQPLFAGAHVTFGEYFLGSMALYGVANVMVLGFGISIANERGQKQDLLMQSTPLPAGVFFVAKALSALAIAVLALVALFLLAEVAGGIDLTATQWLTLTYRAMLCSVPFIGLGFALGYIAGPNSAPAVTNLIYLPTAFASGLFFPLRLLPQFLQNIAPYLPLYRGAQLVWDAVGAPIDTHVTTDWLYMVGFTVAFFTLALWAYRRDQGRKFN
jgi:ABC-2 type transport system permease protein